MANTRFLTDSVEDYIRSRLKERYSQPFSKQVLRLTTGGSHEFDAASADGRVVASIKAASGRTSGGKNPSGKIKDSLAELYYLSLLDAPIRLLILTTPAFHEIFVRKTQNALAPGLIVNLIPLPTEMQAEVDRVVAEASREVSPSEAAREQVEEDLT